MFLDLPDPDPDTLVRGTSLDPTTNLPFSHKDVKQTEIMLGK
jgi:hypothetical protein